jgi:hypothetical protein
MRQGFDFDLDQGLSSAFFKRMSPRKLRLLGMVGLCGLILGAAGSYWLIGPRQSASNEDDFRTTRHLLPQEPVDPLRIASVERAGNAFHPAEQVLGVTIGTESRAYPISVLSERPASKVVNDRLAGRAIAATW